MNQESELLRIVTMRRDAPETAETSLAEWFVVYDEGRPVAAFETWKDAYRFRMALIVKILDQEA